MSLGRDPTAVRRLRNGLALSQLGVGCAPFGRPHAAGVDAQCSEAFADLFAAGLRYLEVAALYGRGLAELRLGAALRQVDRDQLVLSTKVGRLLEPGRDAAAPFEVRYDYGHDGALRSIEHSLQRLGTHRIDIAFIHDVNRQWQGDLVEQRYAEAMGGAYRALERLRREGVIRAIGVGVNDWTILERFAGDGDFDCFMLAGRYTLLDHTALDTFLPMCGRRGIGVLMAAPFNSGILATGARPGATFFYREAPADVVDRVRRIEAVCQRHGVELAAAALQFPLAHPAVTSVVAGFGSREEATHNIAHCRASIPAAFWDELKDAALIDRRAPTSLTVEGGAG